MSDDLIHSPVDIAEKDNGHDEGLAILRRCLAKLSFAAMGLDQELDSQLDHLRGSIRHEAAPDALLTEIDGITRTLMRMEEVAANGGHVAPDYQVFLAELVRRSSGEAASALGSLRKRLADEPAARRAGLVAECLAELLSQTQTPGFFARLFGGRRTPADAADAASAVQPSAPAPAPRTETGRPAIGSDLLRPVQKLLAELSLPENYERRIDELKARLAALASLDELPDLLDSIANLILNAASDDQTRFEAFLQILNQRMEQVHHFLAQSSSTQTEDAQACASLDRQVSVQVQDIHAQMAGANDLEELKGCVNARLDAISTSVGAYKTSQEQRREALQTQIRQLERQLVSVESEANSLRQTLVEQRQRALTDALTGLPNRTAYLERLEQEYARLRRYDSQMALAVMDIDHFKRINDQHGHIAGDAVLKAIAKLLLAGVRKSDFVARIGGEEFVFLLPEIGMAEATKAVNKLRLSIHTRMIEVKGVSLSATASFGVADFREGDTAADVFARADRALYRAKERGRNQVCCELPKGTDPAEHPQP